MALSDYFGVTNWARIGAGLAAFGIAENVSTDVSGATYDSLKDNETFGPFMEWLEGTFAEDVLKDNWPEMIATATAVAAAPDKFTRLLALGGGIVSMFRENMGADFLQGVFGVSAGEGRERSPAAGIATLTTPSQADIAIINAQVAALLEGDGAAAQVDGQDLDVTDGEATAVTPGATQEAAPELTAE